jgi:hypothetical protein
MRLLWLVGQFALVVGFGAVLIAVVIGIWYGVSFLVLIAVSRLFRLRGRAPKPPAEL